MPEALYTVKTLSQYLGLHPNTVYKKARRGEIPSIKKPGLGIRFKSDIINKWLDHHSLGTSSFLESLSQVDLGLDSYDRLFLKGGVKVSEKGKTWNYPFGSVFLRLTKSRKERWYYYYRFEGKRVRKAVKGAQSRADALKVLQVEVADAFRGKHGFSGAYEPVIFEKFAVE